MTNPSAYEDEWPVDPLTKALKVAGAVAVGLALATIAVAALVIYTSARAGRNVRDRLDAATEELGREFRGARDTIADTARSAFHSAAGSAAGQPDSAPAL